MERKPKSLFKQSSLSPTKQSLTSKKNTKTLKTKKILKYVPKKGDQDKQWKIEGIRSQRVSLRPKVVQPSKKKQQSYLQMFHSFQYQKVNQYEIAWEQPNQNLAWANTWEPQENIPQQTRLDYLLKKRKQLRKPKNQNTLLRQQHKENFRKHVQFTIYRQKYCASEISRNIKRTSNKDLAKLQGGMTSYKRRGTKDYKNWFLSYDQKSEGFEKIVQNFLKGISNDILPKKQLTNKKQNTYSNIKMQYITSIGSVKQQQQIDRQLDKILKQIRYNQQKQNEQDEYRWTCMPKQSCLKFVKKVDFVGQKDDINWFYLEVENNQFYFISEQDFAKYLPWSYEQYFIQQITKQMQDAIQKIQKMDQSKYNDKIYFQKLTNFIGINSYDFQENSYNKRSSLFSSNQQFFRPRNGQYHTNLSQHNTQQINIVEQNGINLQKSDSNSSQTIKMQKLRVIQNHFYQISSNFNKSQFTKNYIDQQTKSSQFDQKDSKIFYFISCSNLFKPASPQTLNQSKINKKQKSQDNIKPKNSIKLQNSREQKSKKSKSNLNVKLQYTSTKKQKEKKVHQSKLSDLMNAPDQNSNSRSSRDKNSKNSKAQKDKKSQKIVVKPINQQQQQIQEILGLLQNQPRKKQQQYYDSEDQSSKK